MLIDIPDAQCMTRGDMAIRVRFFIGEREVRDFVPIKALGEGNEVEHAGDTGTLIVEEWVADTKGWFPERPMPKKRDRGTLFNQCMETVAQLAEKRAALAKGPLADCACDECDQDDPIGSHVRMALEALAVEIRSYKTKDKS